MVCARSGTCHRPFCQVLAFHNLDLFLGQPVQLVDQTINRAIGDLDLAFEPFLSGGVLRQSRRIFAAPASPRRISPFYRAAHVFRTPKDG
jgi:hypothetical protein